MAKLTPAQIKAANRARLRAERMEEVRYAQANPEFAAEERRIREYNKAGAQPAKSKTTRKNVQKSLQYRFAAFKAKACRELTVAPEGMSPAFAIAHEAYCQALVELKPKCDTCDTNGSKKVHPLIEKLVEAASLTSYSVPFDWDAFHATLQKEFASDYSGKYGRLNCYPVLDKEQAAVFKANALAQLKELIKSTYVSLR